MNSNDGGTENSDQLHDLYSNYRPGSFASFHQIKRSSFSQPREAAAEPDQSVRRRFSAFPRSKSAGRDPRLTDMARAYQAGQEHQETTGSKDTEYNNGAAARLGWEDSAVDTVSLYSGYSDHNRYGSGTLDNRALHNIDNRSVHSLDNRSVHSMDIRSMHSFDNRSVHSIDNRSVHSTDNWSVHSTDNRSVHSMDDRYVPSLKDHLVNWSPIARDVVPKLSGKRKYSTFDEAISDDDDDTQVLAKRPRTPVNYDCANEPEAKHELTAFLKKLLRIIFKLVLIFVISISMLLCYATYKNYQCSFKQSQALDINLVDKELSSKLYGQHLAHAEIVSSITSFIETPTSTTTTTSPLLVLVLFGWLGSGKTHTSRLISSILPHQSNTHFITCSLPNTLQGVGSRVTRECGYSIVVLDDLDSADNDTLEIIEDLIVSINNDENSKSNGTIVVATTSAGGHAVNKLLLDMAKSSLTSRDTVTYDEIMDAVEDQRDSIPLHKVLTDHNIPVKLVPFLPLTRDHLRMCAIKVAKEQGMDMSDGQVNMILDQVQYFSKEFPIFAKTGCKQFLPRWTL